ncbi:hypothetical protein A3Q56_08146, partial [Intoshia linei]
MPDTYVTSSRQTPIKIINQSNATGKFIWSIFETDEMEENYINSKKNELVNDYNLNIDKLKESNGLNDPMIRDKIAIAEQSLQIALTSIEEERFSNKTSNQNSENKLDCIEHECFKIEPLKGTIYSNCTAACNIKFEPKKVGKYETFIYCRMEGRQKRTKLHLTGESIGAKLEISLETLDLGNCFIGTNHDYNFEICNRGPIDAKYRFIGYNKASLKVENDLMESCHENCLEFCQFFKFTPNDCSLKPLISQSITASFNPKKMGHFNIPFSFRILNSPQLLTISIIGSCVGPSFQINVDCITLHEIAYGFMTETSFIIKNTSQIDFSFSLRLALNKMSNAGHVQEILSEVDSTVISGMQTHHDDVGCYENDNNAELIILPRKGNLKPNESQIVNIEFTPVNVGKYFNTIIIDMDYIGNDLYFIPFISSCTVPNITCKNDFIDLGRCFVSHQYKTTIVLVNDNNLKAKYQIKKDNFDDNNAPIYYFTQNTEGILTEKSVTTIEINIVINRLGFNTVPVCINIVGDSDKLIIQTISATGIGGVVDVSPNFLNWGTMAVLKNQSKVLKFDNQSPISVDYQLSLQRWPNTVWIIVSKVNGTIKPFEKIDIIIDL